MRYAFYPGCSMHASGHDYLESFIAISKYFDIEFEEVRGWTCCAPVAAHGVSHLLSIAVPAVNLSIVEKMNYNTVVVPCAACFSRFKVA
ncbi:MAG: heterodisulfide reductase-related iron-sulfur binding cluster, partial [Candidatus Hydrogenedentota bacterium]